MKRNCKKLVKKSLKQKKYSKEKVINCLSNGKDMIIHSIVGLIKKILNETPSYKVDLSNYASKAYIKNISHVDTSNFAFKTNLAGLKTEVEKLDIDKLAPVSVDLSKLSDVVKNDVVN